MARSAGGTVESWIAIDALADKRGHALSLAREHERAVEGGAPRSVRGLVRESWTRSTTAGVDPLRGLPPRTLSADAAAEAWEQSPLAVATEVLEQLPDADSSGHQVALVCDAQGDLLWIDGEETVLELAKEIHLDRGTRWSEEAAGTNAMGTALALGHPIQIFSAEHFSVPIHNWTCSAAPVRDPETREQIGVIDFSGGLDTAHPHSLTLVSSVASLIEQELAARRSQEHRMIVARHGASVRPRGASALASTTGTVLLAREGEWISRRIAIPPQGGVVALQNESLRAEAVPGGFLLWPEGGISEPPTLRLQVLSPRGATARIAGTSFGLSPRHAEILTLLALRPEGLSADELAMELHGHLGKSVSARAEVSRLRRLLPLRIDTQPYRLTTKVTADFLEVSRLVTAGRLQDALDRYPGELLPSSEAPTVVETRERLEDALREAILQTNDPKLIASWLQNPGGRDDLEACRLLAKLAQPGEAERAIALGRMRRLCGRHDR